MVTSFKELLGLCESELVDREYGQRLKEFRREWGRLALWLEEQGREDFSEEIGIKYCDEAFGNHIITESMDSHSRICLRAVRMLISYQKDGDFEFRSPRVEHRYCGELGNTIESYLSHARDSLALSNATLSYKESYLYDFYSYIEARSLALEGLEMNSFGEFYNLQGYSLPSRHNCSSTLRTFLRYAYDIGVTKKDLSIFLPKDSYKKHSKIPTTYSENEISSVIASVERSSAIGKRDYLVLLLAAEYGWRSKDIVGFCFDHIDWEKNTISFAQSKTGGSVVYPLLASVGNAIIDYAKHGRPKTIASEVIVSAMSATKGNPITSPTVHSIVTKYMRRANVKDWENKKHGAHALRHSLAANMLRKNVSLPTISTIMGHQSTETTKVYLSIDIEKLRLCPLAIPLMRSVHYRTEVV